MNKVAISLSAIVLIIIVAFFGLIFFHFQPIDPHSPDGIARLRLLAQTSRPLMVALEQYHADHGHYPAQLSDLSPAYNGRKTKWYYEGWITPVDEQQYSLSILPGPGHDPILLFRRRADGTSEWVYDPGDGSPETPLPFSVVSPP